VGKGLSSTGAVNGDKGLAKEGLASGPGWLSCFLQLVKTASSINMRRNLNFIVDSKQIDFT
jgi:hypothetical protein